MTSRATAPARGRFGTAAAMIAVVVLSSPGCKRKRPQPQPSPAVTTLGPFRVGHEVSARLTLKLRLELDGGHAQQMEVAARWSSAPADIHDGSVEIACRLSETSVHLSVAGGEGRPGAPNPADRQRAERELATALTDIPFFVTVGGDGAIAGFWFAAGTNPAVANVLMTVAGAQQLVRRGGGDAAAGPAWVVEERDANGAYLAAYRETEAGHVHKEKARYMTAGPESRIARPGPRAVTAPARPAPLVQVEKSVTTFVTDGSGRVLQATAAETLVIALGLPGAPAMKIGVDLRLDDARARDAPTLIGAFAKARPGLEWQPMEQVSSDGKAQQLGRDRLALAGATFDDLRSKLAALPADMAPRDPAGAALTRRFEALFRLDPAAPARAAVLIGTETAARGKVVVDALSLAGTPACHVALGAIAGNRAAPANARHYAVQYLAQQDSPAPAAVAAVAALLDDKDPQLRQMARFTYGACALNLRDSDPGRAGRITDDLLSRLEALSLNPSRKRERGSDADQRAELITALGNAGDARALPALRVAIKGGDARLRARAIAALRFVDAPEIDPLIDSLLGDTRDEGVRRAAIDVVRYRDVGPFAARLADLARRDPAASVRSAAVTLLGDRVSTLPTLRSVLEEVRQSDQTPANRALAARYLK